MRILLVPHAYHPVRGGTESQCRLVAGELAGKGHAVTVLTADVGSVQGYYAFGVASVVCRDEIIDGVSVRRIRYGGLLYRLGSFLALRPRMPQQARLLNRIRRLLNWRFRRAMADGIRRIRPDVVMTMPHLVVNVQTVLSVQAAQGFPLVMLPLLHEEDPHWDIPACSRALRQASMVVANTAHERERLISAYAVSPARVIVGGNAVALPAAAASLPREHDLILFLGRKVVGKGILDLLDAMALGWSQGAATRLVIAGARSHETALIDARVAALPAAWRSCIDSPDDLADADKDALLSRAACLVLPSRIESFGLVLLEAWAQGTPVIAWDLPVFRELVEHGVDGLLVPAGDQAALAAAMAQLVADPALARQMGEAGRRKVGERFSPAAIAARFEQACRQAVASPVHTAEHPL